MSSSTVITVRRIGLVIAAMSFGGFALLSIFFPKAIGEFYAYDLQELTSYSEFRAVFLGFWIGLTIYLLVATWRIHDVLWGNIAGLMIVLQSLGRLYSLIIDGTPDLRFIVFMIGEFLLGMVILLARPKPSAPEPSEPSMSSE